MKNDLLYFIDPEALRQIEEDFREVGERVVAAVAASPKSVKLEDALKQMEEFKRES